MEELTRYLTHIEVLKALTNFMQEQGWQRIKDKRYKFFHLNPDAVFQKMGYPLIIVEVKPEYLTIDEVRKGIGQCAQVLAYPEYRPYFVIPEKWYFEFSNVFAKLPWLGIIAYVGKQMRLAAGLAEDGIAPVRPEVKFYEHKCRRCEYQWISTLEEPKVCASCKSRDWRMPSRTEVKCKKCGYKWVPKTDDLPQCCPHCKSRYWNTMTLAEWDEGKAILQALTYRKEE